MTRNEATYRARALVSLIISAKQQEILDEVVDQASKELEMDSRQLREDDYERLRNAVQDEIDYLDERSMKTKDRG